MRFLTATWSVVVSLIVVLAMFSFVPVALGDPWADGYIEGKKVGITEGQKTGISDGQKVCKQNLSSCTSPTASSSDKCKECLPDSTDGKPYFVTNASTRDETTITDSVKTACRNDPFSCGISTKGGAIIKTKPTSDSPSLAPSTTSAWIKADVKDTLLEWNESVSEKDIGTGHLTWGYFYWDKTADDKNNPEVFAKLYRNKDGDWTNIEFFFVSIGTINVMSCMQTIGDCKPESTPLTVGKRYVRHNYANGTYALNDFDDSNNTVIEGKGDQQNDDMGDGERVGNFKNTKITAAIVKDGTETPLNWYEKGKMGSGAWGVFGTNPDDPKVFVKFWYDQNDKRIDVNFFHTAPEEIKVYSGRKSGDKFLKASSNIKAGRSNDNKSTRYSRHQYRE